MTKVRSSRRRSRRPAALSALLVLPALLAAAALAAAGVAPLWPGGTVELPLPTGAATSPGQQTAAASAVACTSQGNCVAVGSYNTSNTASDIQPLTLAQSGGGWVAASAPALPSGARSASSAQGTYGVLDALSCPAAGGCVAAGSYDDSASALRAMVASQSGGVWQPATPITAPGTADTTTGDVYAQIRAISCTSPGDCTAVGSYADGTGANYTTQAMIATETAGSWAPAIELTPPSGASEPVGNASVGAVLNGVSCTAPGYCVAVGGYIDASGSMQAMIATQIAGGAWDAGELTALPSGANLAPGALAGASLTAVSCADASDCTAVGSYVASGGSSQAMGVTETSGVWGTARQLTLPSGYLSSSGQSAALDAVACTSPGTCSAGGAYDDSDGNSQAMLALQSGGSWSAASELSLPSGAATAPSAQTAELAGLSCAATAICAAVGDYDDTDSDSQAMALSSVAPLAVSTSTLAAAYEDVPYTAQLGATGGDGDYSWSVTDGALPPGLNLDAATGVISGTPTSIISQSFSVAVSDPGPPGQSASAALSINVGDPPAPDTLLGKRTIKQRKHRATFSFSSSGQAIRFECALVRAHSSRKKRAPSYQACRSPKTYKHLLRGHYTFYVRAVGDGGNDPTPASVHFKIA